MELFTPEFRTRNHPMGPVGRVPSNSWELGDQVYLVHAVQLLQLADIFAGVDALKVKPVWI